MAPLKIQPIDVDSEKVTEPVRNEPVSKWRLRRFFVFDKQFPKKDGGGGGGGAAELEPSSVCLAKMVQSFMEEPQQPQPQPQPLRCGRNRCNCFNANSSDEDDFDLNGSAHESATDSTDSLKSLIPCASVEERNLLADAAKIVEKNSKVYKRKEDLIKFVSENLQSLEFMAAAAKQSLKKTGMHVPPWRKRDYMLAKWISPSAARSKQVSDAAVLETVSSEVVVDDDFGELELIFGEEKALPEEVVTASPAWQLPAVKPKSVERGMKVVTGLASLLKEKP